MGVHWLKLAEITKLLFLKETKDLPVYTFCTSNISQCTLSVPLSSFAVHILCPGFYCVASLINLINKGS